MTGDRWLLAAEFWKDGWDALLVFAVVVPEAAFEFGVFGTEEKDSGEGGERHERPRSHGRGEKAPAEHRAEVSGVERVAHASVETRGDESLRVAVGLEFVSSDDLVDAEVPLSAKVDVEGGAPEGNREEASQRSVVKQGVTPRPGEGSGDDPHHDP